MQRGAAASVAGLKLERPIASLDSLQTQDHTWGLPSQMHKSPSWSLLSTVHRKERETHKLTPRPSSADVFGLYYSRNNIANHKRTQTHPEARTDLRSQIHDARRVLAVSLFLILFSIELVYWSFERFKRLTFSLPSHTQNTLVFSSCIYGCKVIYSTIVNYINSELWDHVQQPSFVHAIKPAIKYALLCAFVSYWFQPYKLPETLVETDNDLPRKRVLPTHEFDDDACPICMQELEEDDTILVLSCQHYFHLDCIRPWFYHQKRCPCCLQILVQDAKSGLKAFQCRRRS